MKKILNPNLWKQILFLTGIGLFFLDFIQINEPSIHQTENLTGFDLIFGTVNTPEILLVYPLVLLVIGLWTSFLKLNKIRPIQWLISLAGVIGLVFFQIKYHNYQSDDLLKITFCNGYWFLTTVFALIGCISFLGNGKNNSEQPLSVSEKTTININIITQTKK